MVQPPVSFLLSYRPSSGEPLDECRVQTLDPIRRAMTAGKRVRLPSGVLIHPSQIVSIGRYRGGRLVAAWLVAEHGLDGDQPSPDQPFDWLAAWRGVAERTIGLTDQDPRWQAAWAALTRAEAAYAARDPRAFHAAASDLAQLLG